MSMNNRDLAEAMAKFDALKEQLEALKLKLHSYISKVQKYIVSSKSNSNARLSQISDEMKELQMAINKLKDTKDKLSTEINNEVTKRDTASLKAKEFALQIEDLVKKIDIMQADRKDLEEEIDRYMNEIKKKKEFISNHSNVIDDLILNNEQVLGLRIETGGADDLLSFVFWNVDPDDFNREVYFVMNPQTYQIVETNPTLEKREIDSIVDSFKKHKEVGYLWKDMRSALKKKLLG
ncbi:unnamed protein product [Ambrosiozyma monospora]|uniref:Kinetochore protein SPC25 n=1 Tax=Ambrosiozyma monospora TaxID=43982 RepID=A0A9W7DI84_AMBMO|nr:unnamed protein product [Ambrosiozyma monospora]